MDLIESNGQRIDIMTATRFSSYVIKLPRKVVWLINQFRPVNDLYGTGFSNFRQDDPVHRRVMVLIKRVDNQTLSEGGHLFTNARNTAGMLARYAKLNGGALYHPAKMDEFLRNETYGDYFFSIGRLDPIKRVDLLVRAMQYVRSVACCLIAGTGPQLNDLQALVESLKLSARVNLLGYVDDQWALDLFANSFVVYYAPYDEDYAYVTLEAYESQQPVITPADSGGVLEFVQDIVNGFVCESADPRQIAATIDRLFSRRTLCESMGKVGFEKFKHIPWDNVISKLTEGL